MFRPSSKPGMISWPARGWRAGSVSPSFRRARSWIPFLGLLGSLGCSPKEPASLTEPVVFIGIDSADWHSIDPLMEAGRMPHFEALVRRGVRAPLQSLVPLQKSPTIWTTIATGKRPVKHGIADFITHEKKAQTSELRTALAFWEILGAMGRRQAVLGWWITHPATALEGVMVSDFLPYFSRRDREGEAAVYPPQLWPEIAPYLVTSADVSDSLLRRFADLDLLREHGEAGERLLKDLREFIAGDLAYARIARHLYSRERFDVFTVYFRGLDMVCHEYWRWFEPIPAGVEPSDWRVRALGQVVPRYYEFVDELVGEVLGYVDPKSRILVVSDHGFVGPRRGRGGTTVGVQQHRDTGILVLAGPGIRHRAALDGADVKDVMPTLLAMCGVPLADDLDGAPLMDAFGRGERRWFAHLIEISVPSYEGVVARGGRAGTVSDEVNEAVLERLRSLGYIE